MMQSVADGCLTASSVWIQAAVVKTYMHSCNMHFANMGFQYTSCQQLPLCREAVLALCLTAAAPAEAMIHPTLALLQSLVCHTWCAYQRHPGQHLVQQAAACQSKAEDLTHHQSLQSMMHKQQQQPPEGRQLPVGEQAEQGVAVNQHSLGIGLHTSDLRDSFPKDISELQTQQMQSEQEMEPQLSQHVQSSLEGFSPEHQPKTSSVRAAALEQLLDQTLLTEQSTMRSPWCCTSATCPDAQAQHLKLLLCAMVLAALPFVAWLKQPKHMRQWACTQDALPAAIVAMHATVLCLLVSVSDPYALCMITVPSAQVFLCLLTYAYASIVLAIRIWLNTFLDMNVHSEQQERRQRMLSCWYSLQMVDPQCSSR